MPKVIPAYSSDTNTPYDSWDDLVSAEANGYVVTIILTKGNKTWPWSKGPFATQEEAKKYAVKQRRYLNKTNWEHPKISHKVFVRPLWKDLTND